MILIGWTIGRIDVAKYEEATLLKNIPCYSPQKTSCYRYRILLDSRRGCRSSAGCWWGARSRSWGRRTPGFEGASCDQAYYVLPT